MGFLTIWGQAMRRLCTGIVSRFFGIVLSIAIGFGPALSYVRPAYASSATEPAAQTPQSTATPDASNTAAAETSPTIVREVTGKRTETSNSYLLSNGSYEKQIFSEPVNYPAADGSMQPIDTSLMPDPNDPGALKSTATPVTSKFSDGFDGAPVTLSTPSWSASIDFLGAAEPTPIGLGSDVVYGEVAQGTDLSYEALSSGAKETLVLHGASSPSTYRFKVGLTGLELRLGADGTPAAYLPGSSHEVLSLGTLTVWDSSKSGAADEPAYCQNASTTVEAVPGGAIVTYHIDPAWLADPARVFPVKVDPTLTTTAGRDTFVGTANPDTSYDSVGWIRSGQVDPTSTGYSRSYVGFDVSSLASSTVTSATLNLQCSYHFDPFNCANKRVYLRTAAKSWSSGSTWNNQPGWGPTVLGYTDVTGTGSYNFNVGASTVQGWVDSPPSNNGLCVYQYENGTQDKFMSDFYSREYAAYLSPHLTVIYTQSVPAVVTSATAQVSGAEWFRRADSNGDGAPDTSDDVASKGRGTVTLTWPKASGAAGYGIYASDGGKLRRVGLVQGSTSTTWSSAGAGIFPTDSRITQMGAGANGLAQASTPSTATRETTFVAKSGANADLGGAGLVVSDGTHLYVHRWSSYGGPSSWVEVASGLKDTSVAAGSFIATVGPVTPMGKSAFYLDGYIYLGCTPSDSATSVLGVWKDASDGSAQTHRLSFSKNLLSNWNGADLTATSTQDVQLASDGKQVYSASMTTTATTGYDGWKIRIFDHLGTWQRDLTVPGPSYYTDGFLVDGKSAYFIEWTQTDGARITRASLDDGRITGQWTIDQEASGVVSGAFDPSNNAIWLGELGLSGGHATIHRFTGPGLDLRDNPNALYKQVAPTGPLSSSASYSFKVVPYNQAGEAPTSTCTTVTAQLPNRTYSALEDPRHTTCDFRSALDNSLGANLETGALTVDVTDLDIKSWGPEASLTRHYSSRDTSTGSFGTGWRASFEQVVTQTAPAVVAYVDGAGERHSFVSTAGVYVAPAGCYSTLTSSAGVWALTDNDRTVSRFDGASGRIQSVTDVSNNTTKYTWTPPDASAASTLAIKAANGQSISVTFNAGQLMKATYATADGTRSVDYNWSAGTVTYDFGVAGQQRTTTYVPGTGSRLASINVTSAAAPGLGTWTFGYDAATSKLTTVTYPGYDSTSHSDLSAQIAYPASTQAKVTTHGDVDGATSAIYQVFDYNPTGTESDHSNTYVSAETPAYWRYAYAPGNESIIETSPAGALVRRTVDASGNTLFEWDENGHMTTSLYDDYSNCVREVDPRGDTTWRSYDASGNLLSENKQLNDTDVAHTGHSYNTSGTVTQDSVATTGTQSAVTDYSGFSLSGEPATIIQRAVVISVGSPATDLTVHRGFDAFGNLTSEIDAAGVRTVSNAYSPTTKEHVVMATDATNTVTHQAYDAYGRETDTSRTATDGSYTGWSTKSYDAFGQSVSESVLAAAASTDSVTTHTFDALGHETAGDTDKVAGASKTVYDARGEVKQSWAEGSDTANQTASTRSTFDAYGQQLTNIEPGSVASQTVTTYYPNGQVKKVVNSDGTWEIDHYDEADNKILAQTSSDDGTQTATSVFDVGGRNVSETDADLNVTTHSYDLADHETGAASQDQTASTTTINTLGWQLSQRDADGITTAQSYDLDGRVTSQTVGGLTTKTTFDALGNAVKVISPDLSVRTVTYDKLGRQSGESQVTSLGVSIKDTASVFDSLSRTVDSTEKLSGGLHQTQTHNEFAANASKPSTVTVTRDGGVSIVSNYDSLGEQTIATAQVATSTPVIRSLIATDATGRETAWTTGGKSVGQVFDSASHLTAQTGLGFSSPGAAYVYSQTCGKKTSESLPFSFPAASENATYAYDSVSRLATWTASGVCGLGGSTTATYSYNPQSAITTVGLSAAAGPWAKGATVFGYSGTGTLASKSVAGVLNRTYGYDSATGARIWEKPSGSATTTAYTWVGGRLARYTDSSKGTTATYSYDANGQRTRSIVASAGGTTSTDYVYQGLTLLSLSATSSGNASYTIDYLYDGSGRPYAGFYRDESTAAVTAFDIVTTDRGDVAELTDVSGTPFALYRYDPWGNSLSTTSSAGSMVATLAAVISARQPLRYAGYAFDAESGLYYCSARYYDSATCQFVSKDAARADGEASAYQYCGGDPVGQVDPSGQRWIGKQVMGATQKNTNWCWAACSVAVVKFIRPKSKISQHKCVDWLLGQKGYQGPELWRGDFGNIGATAWEIASLWIHYKLTKAHVKGPLVLGSIQRQLKSGHPFVVGIRTSINGFDFGHAIVVDQVTSGNSAKKAKVDYMDPRDGKHHRTTLAAFPGPPSYGLWHWAESVVVR